MPDPDLVDLLRDRFAALADRLDDCGDVDTAIDTAAREAARDVEVWRERVDTVTSHYVTAREAGAAPRDAIEVAGA